MLKKWCEAARDYAEVLGMCLGAAAVLLTFSLLGTLAYGLLLTYAPLLLLLAYPVGILLLAITFLQGLSSGQ